MESHDQNLPADNPAVFFLWGATRIWVWLARFIGCRDHRFFERCRLSPAPSRGPDQNRSGLRLDFDFGDHDGNHRNGHDETGRKFPVPLEKRRSVIGRSEERRVGKECRYRWWTYQ